MPLVDSQLVIHFPVWLIPEHIIHKLLQIVNHPTLRQLIGLESILGKHIIAHVLRTCGALIQIIVVIGYLVQDTSEVVAFRIVVLLSICRVALDYQQGIIIVMSQCCRHPRQLVVPYVSSPSCHHFRLALDGRQHPESIYYRHDGIVGSRGFAANIHTHQVSVLHFQTVRYCPDFQVSITICSDADLRLFDGRLIFVSVNDDVGGIDWLTLVLLLQIINRVGVKDQITRVAESIFLIHWCLGSTEGMGSKLVAEVSVPLDSLKAGSLLPHSPEELSCLSVALRVGTLILVFQKPFGKGSFALHFLHIVLDEEARDE